jgi:hypothetical protein
MAVQMNLVVAALLDVHAKLAAEARGETPQPEAKWALKTEVPTGDDDVTEEDNREMRIHDEQGER